MVHAVNKTRQALASKILDMSKPHIEILGMIVNWVGVEGTDDEVRIAKAADHAIREEIKTIHRERGK